MGGDCGLTTHLQITTQVRGAPLYRTEILGCAAASNISKLSLHYIATSEIWYLKGLSRSSSQHVFE